MAVQIYKYIEGRAPTYLSDRSDYVSDYTEGTAPTYLSDRLDYVSD